MKPTLEEYIEQDLSKQPSDWYDPNGNSPRAVMTRGMFREILYTYKVYPKRVKRAITDFDGFDTPISWFVAIPLLLILSPIVPLIVGVNSFKRAKRDYVLEYNAKYASK